MTEELARGFWGTENAANHRRVSAVLFTKNLWSATVLTGQVYTCLYLNPWAERPYKGLLTLLPTFRFENGEAQEFPGKMWYELMGQQPVGILRFGSKPGDELPHCWNTRIERTFNLTAQNDRPVYKLLSEFHRNAVRDRLMAREYFYHVHQGVASPASRPKDSVRSSKAARANIPYQSVSILNRGRRCVIPFGASQIRRLAARTRAPRIGTHGRKCGLLIGAGSPSFACAPLRYLAAVLASTTLVFPAPPRAKPGQS
jgi:hypothetical protein